MARRSAQTREKLDRERAKRETRERKQQKRADVAAARAGQPSSPGVEPQSEDSTAGEPD
jgi:hypothetical protein